MPSPLGRKATGTGLAAALAGTLALMPMPAAADTARDVPPPQVDGPLPGAPPGDPQAPDMEDTYPFFSSTHHLKLRGYVEEEFLISGSALAYDGPEAGEEHPYTTRVVVRRPAHERRSNGQALVEWQNVTAGHDLDALWGPSSEHIMRSGYTWVGVSAQQVGVDQLREWSPARYGDLDVTDGGSVSGDALSWDIFSQAGQAVLSGELTGDFDHDQVLGIGASQSAMFMVDYYDEVLPGIESIYDGYAFMVGPAPITERSEPVFQVLSETDLLMPDLSGPPREDSEFFRSWQVAGASHSAWQGQQARLEESERDLPEGAAEYECQQPPFSRIPLHQVFNSAYDHLADWSAQGTAPPTAEPIARDEDGDVLRDEDGHAEGGIRTSQLDVPTAINTGVNTPADPDSAFCALFGSHEPFEDEELAERYPNPGRYISSVVRSEVQNVRDGYIVRADSVQNKREAAKSGVGR